MLHYSAGILQGRTLTDGVPLQKCGLVSGLGIVLSKTANLVKPVCYREDFMALVGVSEGIGSDSSPVAPEFKLPKMQHRDSLPPQKRVHGPLCNGLTVLELT